MDRTFGILLLLLTVLFVGTSAKAMGLLPGPPTKSTSRDTATTASETKTHSPLLADKIVVKKSERKLYLFKQDKPFRVYKISLGFRPAGHKRHRGDGRTPEGRYYIDQRNTNSRFRKALRLSYPSPQDRLHARRRGVDPGGMIMVHGQPAAGSNSELRQAISKEDWTQGCIAVSNMAIDEIWDYTSAGTPIEILP